MPRSRKLPFPDVTTKNFKREVIDAGGPVVVDFWAPWCAPCLALGRALEELAPTLPQGLKVVKVDIDAHPELALRYGVHSIPTLMFVDGGKPIGALRGAHPASLLADIFVRFVASTVN